MKKTLLTMSLLSAPASVPADCVIASYYGKGFHGRQTANQEIFSKNKMTAAHKTMKFGTKLKVTRGKKSVIVRINDRGPYVRGRSIDLSEAAARRLGMIGVGVGRVCYSKI